MHGVFDFRAVVRVISTADLSTYPAVQPQEFWATIEFWRRIAVGESFGTGKDSVIINDTSGNRKKPLQREQMRSRTTPLS